MSQTVILPLHSIEIMTARGSEVLTTEVPRHEIDVLRAVHGPDKIRDRGEIDDEIELNANADAEFARLKRKYHRINSGDPVIVAYRTGPSGLKSSGFDLGRGVTEASPQAGVHKHPKPKQADAKAKPEKKAE